MLRILRLRPGLIRVRQNTSHFEVRAPYADCAALDFGLNLVFSTQNGFGIGWNFNLLYGRKYVCIYTYFL